MTAIYKREVKSFLTSMIGYVFIAFLLAVAGIYFSAYHAFCLSDRCPYPFYESSGRGEKNPHRPASPYFPCVGFRNRPGKIPGVGDNFSDSSIYSHAVSSNFDTVRRRIFENGLHSPFGLLSPGMQFSLHRPVSLLCHRESGDRRRADLCRAADLLLKSGNRFFLSGDCFILLHYLPASGSSPGLGSLLYDPARSSFGHYFRSSRGCSDSSVYTEFFCL